jgi:hypothetical protein
VPPRDPESERQALETLGAYMEAFSAHDWPRAAQTFHYPHVRIASGQVTVYMNAQEYAAVAAQNVRDESYFGRGWSRSAWDSREVIHGSSDKVHLAVQFTRYDEHNAALATSASLWVVTCLDGHWGVQARSSLAP